jgi:hypothetical protein
MYIYIDYFTLANFPVRRLANDAHFLVARIVNEQAWPVVACRLEFISVEEVNGSTHE